MPAFGNPPTYEVMIMDRKGKGWFSLRLSDGRPARFSAPPSNYIEAMKLIAVAEDELQTKKEQANER
jgi:hypothetical protein